MLLGQNFNNPYTTTGIGEIQDIDFAHLSGIEPLGLTHQQKSSYSLQNPASYSSLNFTTFNVGLAGKLYNFKGQENASFSDNRAGFGYLTLGLPIMKEKNWGASFGLVPVSQIGFKFEEQREAPVDYSINGNGRGGLSKFYIGTGAEIIEGLRIGVNAAYLFGSRDQFTTYDFDQFDDYLNSRKILSENAGGFIFKGGLQYTYNLSEEMDLILGATGRIPRSVNFQRDKEVFVFPQSESSSLARLLNEGIADTVSFESESGSMDFPGNYKASIELRKKESWRIGLGAEYGQWSDLVILEQNQGLSDAYEFNLGGQITPDNEGSSYFERMNYRLGIKYANSYWNPAGDALQKYEVNIGMGFPLFQKQATTGRDQQSSVDISVAYGTMGEAEGKQWRQNYLKFKLGFNLSENWFIERKIK